MNDRCEIQYAEDVLRDLTAGALPRSVSKRLPRVQRELSRQPRGASNIKNIKKLRGWRGLYRYRLGDHRLVYRVVSGRGRCVVTLLYLGHRKHVYRDLGHDPQHDAPTVRVVRKTQAKHLLPPTGEANGSRLPSDGPTAASNRLPTWFKRVVDDLDIARDERRALAKCRTADDLLECDVSHELLERVMDALWPPEIDPPLPDRFSEVLERLEVIGEDLSALQGCRTEGQLLDCGLPEELVDRIIYALWPRSVDRAVGQPRRVVESPQELEDAVTGRRPLESFLLALDQSQRPVVDGFAKQPTGPRIVKGGPGTGKTTVALYCLKHLVRPKQLKMQSTSSPPCVLLTTYTNALVAASRRLLRELGVEEDAVESHTVDSLAKRHASSPWAKAVWRASDTVWKEVAGEVLMEMRERHAGFSWAERDSEFLFDEINEVIVGRRTRNLDEYRGIERHGRGGRAGRILGRRQRKHVWDFAVAAFKKLKDRNRCLRAHLFLDAMKAAHPVYDYVFIEEAQDLPPVAIQMCVNFAKNPRNVFLTADLNQSIYTSGFSWKAVSESLNMRGRSTILRRNHRTTQEIMDAIRPILADDERADRDTRDTKCVRRGPRPAIRFEDAHAQVDTIVRWLDRVVAEEPDLDMTHAAVLCPTNALAKTVAQAIDDASGKNARYMTRDGVDLQYDGIKVMTMHTAKGLQFPIVAVVGLEEGRMPFTDPNNPEQQEDTDRWHRVFFVACSRAMRQLLVLADKARPSPFVRNLDMEQWTTE